jgi:hypothetical protein
MIRNDGQIDETSGKGVRRRRVLEKLNILSSLFVEAAFCTLAELHNNFNNPVILRAVTCSLQPQQIIQLQASTN